MARGLLYIASFDSDKYCHYNRIEIWEEGYVGQSTVKALGGHPIWKREKGDGGVYGTSLELLLQSDLNSELVKLYTSDNKKFLVKLYRNNILYWQGFILPERYTEPSVSPPYDVQIAATDGLGVLKNLDFALTGRRTILEILKYCLDLTGLNLDFEIICDLRETSQDITRANLAQVTTNTGQWSGKKCYEVLGEICSSYRMLLTEQRGRWRIARFADLGSDSMIYSNSLVYQGTIGNSLFTLGSTSDDVYPIDSLTREILPAYKSCRFTRTFVKKDSFFANPSFKLLDGWAATGNVETEYDNGVHYAVLEGVAEGQGLSQTIPVEASERAFTLALSYFHKYQAPYKFFIDLQLSAGATTYYLTPDGWSTSKGDSFQFNVDITSITYQTTDKVRAFYAIPGEVNKTMQETGEISFEGFPASGDLTLNISVIGSATIPNGSRRGKLYITGANLTTETPKGLEVKAQLSSASEAASDIEIFFGDTETADNSDNQMFNNLKLSDGRFASKWQVGSYGLQNSFFNTVIKDYVCSLGLSKESLSGVLQSPHLSDLSILYERYTGVNFFISTFSHNLMTDEMEVAMIELIPYMDIASIATAEVEEENPEVIIDYVRGADGILRKTYTVASAGTSYIRGAESTLQDLNDTTVEGLKKISNFSKALAALAQQRADNANLKALAAASSAADALLRLNNIVSNKIISREEKAGLRELLTRLATEVAAYAEDTANHGADLTALNSSLNALSTFLNTVVLINTDDVTELSDEQINTYNSLFSDFYAKRSLFTTDVSKLRSELVTYKTVITTLSEAKARCDAEYNSLYSISELASSFKNDLINKKNLLDSAYNNYSTGLSGIVNDDKITEAERLQATNLQSAYNTALSNFNISVEAAKKSITDSIGKTLADWVADGYISPLEKFAVKQTRSAVLAEKDTLFAKANIYSVNTSPYISAWTTYDLVLVKYSAESPSNIPVESDLSSAEASYKTEKTNLETAITNTAKSDTSAKHPLGGLDTLDFKAKKITSKTLVVPSAPPVDLALNEWSMFMEPSGFTGEQPPAGVGSISALSEVGDVTYSGSLSQGQVLQYDSTLSKWKNILLDFTRISGFISDNQFADNSVSANRILSNTNRRFVTDAQIESWNGNSISGLAAGYLPYWNGTRLINSAIQQTDTDVFITSRNLYLDGKTNKSIKFQSLYNWYYYLGIVGNDFRFYDYDNTDFLRFSWASDKYLSLFGSMFVRNGGFVGVGYSSDPGTGNKFAVNGAGYFNGSLKVAKAITPFTENPMQIWDPLIANYGLTLSNYNSSSGVEYRVTTLDAGTIHNVLSFCQGNVGVGTPSPVAYSGMVSLTIGDSVSNKMGLLKFKSIYNSGNGAEIFQNSVGTIYINVNSSKIALTIGEDGNVGAASFVEGGVYLSNKYAALAGYASQAFSASQITLNSLTSGYLPYANASKVLTNSPLYYDGANMSMSGKFTATTFSAGSYLLDGISINTPGTLSNVAYKGTLSNTYLPKWDSANARIINSIMRDDGSTVYVGGKLSASTLNAGILQIDNLSINTPGVLGNVAYKGYLSTNALGKYDGQKLIDSLLSDNGKNVGINYSYADCLFGVGQSTQGWGTVSNDAGGTSVTGYGTQFLNDFKKGDTFTIGGDIVTVVSVSSNTYMITTVIANSHSYSAYTLSGGAKLRVYGNGIVRVQELQADKLRIPSIGSTTTPTGLTEGAWYFYIYE